MEGLLDSFSGACKVSKEEHPHFALYKAKLSKISQEKRRTAFLDAQKSKRYDYVSHARELATNEVENVNAEVEEMEGAVDDSCSEMDVDLRPRRSPRIHKDQLMMSEWMVEVPEDLSINWVLLFCPIGKRSLVVASRGVTKAYSRSGYCMNSFPSALPGGSRKGQNGVKSSAYTLLDCIYNDDDKTFYVLDMICWNSHPLYDSDSEFRFYWVDTKLRECPQAMECSSTNPLKFVPLPTYPCSEESLKEALWSPLPFPCKLDGLLFFHKMCHYIPKRTPLVCWLKGFMVPEVLNLSVPETMLSDAPPSYTTMRNYVPKAFIANEKQKAKDERVMQVEET